MDNLANVVVNGKDTETGALIYNQRESKPWHGKGIPVDGAMTSKEAIKPIDFEVAKRPVFTSIKDSYLSIPEHVAVVRTDNEKPLAIVGKNYEVIQNREAFEFLDGIVGAGRAVYETAGALGAGEKVFIQLRLPDNIEFLTADKKQEVINQYLLCSNTHDGTGVIRLRFTPVRVVCQNTLNAALNGTCKSEVRIRHTKSAKAKLDQAAEVLGIVKNTADNTKEIFVRMSQKFVTPEDIKTYLEKLLPVDKDAIRTTRRDNIVSVMEKLVMTGKGNDGKTVWDLYNGVTEYVDHHCVVKGENDRWENATFGAGFARKEAAFNLALELVK